MRERLRQTPSQTAGPYVHIGLTPAHAGLEPAFEALGGVMSGPRTKGERITVAGRILDGAGAPVRDGVVEIWQADAAGRYPARGDGDGGPDSHFGGFGRCACDGETGEFRFETIRPGPLGDGSAPHIGFWIFARGINAGLHTRMYFPEDDLGADPLLARIEHRDRIASLVAAKEDAAYRFEIRLQGEGETVFFDI
jgi:protocatechuate 3,4-dioxygenase, alpha subunit